MIGKALSNTILVLLCGLLITGPCEAAKKRIAAKSKQPVVSNEMDAESADRAYTEFAAAFFTAYASQADIHKYKSFDNLDTAFNRFLAGNQPLKAVALIVANQSLVNKNTDNPKLIGYVDLLLQYNELKIAERFYSAIKDEGNKSLTANVSYVFAKYYYSRNNWEKTLTYIEGTIQDLPQEKAFHALLMQGVALQHQKQHRTALKLYEKIPATSKYYLAARTNMAVADIRQDWWTDAHIVLNTLIHSPGIATNVDSVDRLYTILGYSYLQQQYYRDSREAFRNVGVDSPFTNQALLGIALNAANQEDFIGALNAVRILKEKKSKDLPAEEAYLLMPYFYERLQQTATAAAGYTEAIQYYEQRINEFNSVLQYDSATFAKAISFPSITTASVLGTTLDVHNHIPPAMLVNYQLLNELDSSIQAGKLPNVNKEFDRLKTQFIATMQKLTNAAIQERISYLTDYMNQSRYGTARLVDKNETSAN